MVAHASLTDPNLHEPKGVATATSGQVYTASGAGSGTWTKPFKYVGVASSYSTGAPYVHATTVGDTVLNPTVANLNVSSFTVQAAPNFRLRYDGTETFYGKMIWNVSVQHAAGANRDHQFVLYKNGIVIANSRMITTIPTATWTNITLMYDLSLATNDYVEVFAQGSAAYNASYAKVYASIEGHVA
jgi:hypothetical protein